MSEQRRYAVERPNTQLSDQGDYSGVPAPKGGQVGVLGGAPPCFWSASDQRRMDPDTGLVQGRRGLPPDPSQIFHR